MKNFLGIILIILLFSIKANASLFNSKTYAKCEFRSQEFGLYDGTLKYKKDHFEYFAFDKEFFYYKYNIIGKEFHRSVEIINPGYNIKISRAFLNYDQSTQVEIIFNPIDGLLKIEQFKSKNKKGTSSLNFDCNKISKNKLPKSKF